MKKVNPTGSKKNPHRVLPSRFVKSARQRPQRDLFEGQRTARNPRSEPGHPLPPSPALPDLLGLLHLPGPLRLRKRHLSLFPSRVRKFQVSRQGEMTLLSGIFQRDAAAQECCVVSRSPGRGFVPLEEWPASFQLSVE